MSQTIYVIADYNWQYNDNWYDRTDSKAVKAYSDKEYADFVCTEMEREERKRVDCPFWFGGGYDAATSLSEEAFVEKLISLYLPLPEKDDDGYNFIDWWYDISSLLEDVDQNNSKRAEQVWLAPEELREGLMKVNMDDIWLMLDKLRFFRGVEVAFHGASPNE